MGAPRAQVRDIPDLRTPGVVGKARLLEANAPRRTLSPMDEAHVVRALADDDQLTPAQITKLLGRGRGWVDRRLTLGRRLAPALAGAVDAGRLSATTAHALAPFPRGEQPRLADAILRHGLRTREAEAGNPATCTAPYSTRNSPRTGPPAARPAARRPRSGRTTPHLRAEKSGHFAQALHLLPLGDISPEVDDPFPPRP
jgi:ParB-like chromosome segregation protein Spo0J